MKVSIFVGVFLCALLSLSIVGIALWTSTSKPAPDNAASPTNAGSNRFARGSDTVVGNETPFRPEW